jgi:hypothetical protein
VQEELNQINLGKQSKAQQPDESAKAAAAKGDAKAASAPAN